MMETLEATPSLQWLPRWRNNLAQRARNHHKRSIAICNRITHTILQCTKRERESPYRPPLIRWWAIEVLLANQSRRALLAGLHISRLIALVDFTTAASLTMLPPIALTPATYPCGSQNIAPWLFLFLRSVRLAGSRPWLRGRGGAGWLNKTLTFARCCAEAAEVIEVHVISEISSLSTTTMAEVTTKSSGVAGWGGGIWI